MKLLKGIACMAACALALTACGGGGGGGKNPENEIAKLDGLEFTVHAAQAGSGKEACFTFHVQSGAVAESALGDILLPQQGESYPAVDKDTPALSVVTQEGYTPTPTFNSGTLQVGFILYYEAYDSNAKRDVGRTEAMECTLLVSPEVGSMELPATLSSSGSIVRVGVDSSKVQGSASYEVRSVTVKRK